MKLNINPVHCDGLNCFEDIIITLASHYNIEYRLAFCDTWGFEFKSQDLCASGLLGERIGNDVKNINNLLYKYCNVSIVRFDNDPIKLLDMIKMHLAQETPVGLFIDTFWCPWIQGRYQRIHDVHHCLIIGIDDDNNLYCIDPSISMSILTLYYNDFINGCKNCIKYEFGENDTEPDYLKILNESIANINNKNIHNKIQTFANEFKYSFDISSEYRNYNIDVWYVLIDRNLRLIASGRTLYADFIELISKKLQSDKLLVTKYELQKVASNWNKIRGILTRSYRKGYTDNVKEKVYTLLNEISDYEKDIINNLYQTAEVNTFEIKKDSLPIVNDKNEFTNTQVITLNLEEVLNNKGFAASETDTYKADLTGIGFFFINDGLENKSSIQVNNMYFKLPEIVTKKYDNIACSGQKIDIEKSMYHSIMFLGCSDNGDFIDDVTIIYENGEELKISISFTDSWRLPKFNESIAWTGSGGKWTDNTIERHLIEQRIFAREELIKKRGVIEAIKLPDCSNIHIFAISLRKFI